MAQQGRKIAWILGAGASRGAGAYALVQRGGRIPIPIQSDFWSTILRFADSKSESKIVSFLYRYFKGYSKTPPRLTPSKRRSSLNSIDVEEVFTFLSERIASPTLNDQQRVHFELIYEVLRRVLADSLSRFKSSLETKRMFKKFKSNLFRTRDSLISFNYDLILESNLQGRNIYWHPKRVNDKGTPVFKPHGSINFYLEAPDSEQILVSDGVADDPFIIPPTHLKFVSLRNITDHNYLDTNADLAKIWQGMESALKASKLFVFVGYSFPDADLYFSSVFRNVLTSLSKEVPIVIVNPDALRISEKVRARFGISANQVTNYFDFRSFCDIKREDIIRK